MAFLCPGQGAQSPAMLPMLRESALAMRLLEQASDLIGDDLRAADERDAAFFARNDVSAMLVSIASITAHEKLAEQPNFYAGYSVGQWTAMHLAGMLSAESLLNVLVTRAQMMNATDALKGGMLAVIGLPREKVEDVLQGIDGYITIANDNAPGQYTLAGDLPSIEKAHEQLALLKPQKLLRVPVAGAWHSEMVRGAAAPFLAYLESVALKTPCVPVIGNVTAAPIPADAATLRATLAAHIHSPVRWADSIRYLIAQGVETCVEVGYESTLTKFGFFIDRGCRHIHWSKLCVA